MKKIFVCILCVLSSASFAHTCKTSVNKMGLLSAECPAERKTMSGHEMKLGVALSGGGIRSSMFSIGVLKALYDANILDDVDIYSFVSGGGYAGLWLMLNEVRGNYAYKQSEELLKNRKRFGFYAFDNSRFTVNMCELMTKSNLVAPGRFLSFVVKHIKNPSMYTVGYYEEALRRTYSWYFDQSKGVVEELPVTPLVDFKKYLKEMPYFMYSATIMEPEVTSTKNYKADIVKRHLVEHHFELTPVHYGNDKLGFSAWKNSRNDQWLSISRAAAISGAAVPKLLQQEVQLNFDTENSQSDYQANLVLADGGKSENLGILPLLRRNIKTIIAIDAEDDPDQIYEGYYKLKDHLSAWGYTISQPTLDKRKKKEAKRIQIGKPGKRIHTKTVPEWWERELTPALQKAVFTVIVHKEGETHDNDTTIHYVKMNRSDESVYKELYQCWRSPGLKADYESEENKTEHARIREFLDITKKPSGDWNCPALAATEFSGVKWAKEDAIIRIANDFDGDFPTRTTYDQSYYIDQTASYIGLGYILGSEINLRKQ